jgi:hypothetical protein
MPNAVMLNEVQDTLIKRLLEFATNSSVPIKLNAITSLIRLAEKINSQVLWTEISILTLPLVMSPYDVQESIAWLPKLICHNSAKSEIHQQCLALFLQVNTKLPFPQLFEFLGATLSSIIFCQDTELNGIFIAHLRKIAEQMTPFYLGGFASNLKTTIQSCKNKDKLREFIPLFNEIFSRELPSHSYLFLVECIPFMWDVLSETQRAELITTLRTLFMNAGGSSGSEQIFESMLTFSDKPLRKVILTLVIANLTASSTNATIGCLRNVLANALPDLLLTASEEEYAHLALIIELLHSNMTANFAKVLPQILALDVGIPGVYHIITSSIEKILEKGVLPATPRDFILAASIPKAYVQDMAESLPKALVDSRSPVIQAQLERYLYMVMEAAGSSYPSSIRNAIARNLPEAIVACQDEKKRSLLNTLFIKLSDTASAPFNTEYQMSNTSTIIYMNLTALAQPDRIVAQYAEMLESDAESLRNTICKSLKATLPLLFCMCDGSEKLRLIAFLHLLIQIKNQSLKYGPLAIAISQTIATSADTEVRTQLADLLKTIVVDSEGQPMSRTLAYTLTDALGHCKQEHSFFIILSNISRIIGQGASVRATLANSLVNVAS